jgi:hypothetical protein
MLMLGWRMNACTAFILFWQFTAHAAAAAPCYNHHCRTHFALTFINHKPLPFSQK